MLIEIIGDVDKNRLYCAGSFTKLLTVYACLSLLAEKHDLNNVLDDEHFLDVLCVDLPAREFLEIFQKIIGSRFTLRDLCSHYSGLPYTFDLSAEELEQVDSGQSFKHHSIVDEQAFLSRCRNNITRVYPARCKFHYSELAIIFLGYLTEKIFDTAIEVLYKKYVLEKFFLKNSFFSRSRIKNAYCQDLSNEYDYPSIAILDHGYFCYSNGYYTNLHDMQILIGCLLDEPVFQYMVDIKKARAASNRLLNGLSVEIRLVGDDILYGYEGLSFSGCNIWAYSTKTKKGYITFNNSEEKVYDIVYGELGHQYFDKVPDYTQKEYKNFINCYSAVIEEKKIPDKYQGSYVRVKINETELAMSFEVSGQFIIIRNPEKIKYDIIYVDGHYRIKCKDNIHGATVGLYQANSGNHYMLYDGTLYKKSK